MYITRLLCLIIVLLCFVSCKSEVFDVEKHLDKGISQFEGGMHEQAFETFNLILEKNPKIADALAYRGDIHLIRKNYSLALQDYAKCNQLNRKYVRAWAGKAKTRHALGDLVGAINDYNRVLNINSRHIEAYHFRGLAKIEIGDPYGGLEDLSKSLSIDSLQADTYRQRGELLLTLGDSTKAFHDFSQASGLGDSLATNYLLGFTEK